MKKYNVKPIRTDEYIIEIDEKVWNEEALKDWGSAFFQVNLQELVEHLTSLLMRYGYERFLEGFGYVYVQNQDGYKFTQFDQDENGNLKEVTEFAEGIKVTIVSEDEDFEFETEEIQQ